MKKLLSSLLVLAMFLGTGAAFAEGDEPAVQTPTVSEAALTTKKYVDDGLIYVYGKATEAAGAAADAATAAGNAQDAADAAQDAADAAQDAADAAQADVDVLEETVAGHTETLSGLQGQIDALELSSSDTTYAAGTGITISGNNNAVSVAGLAATASDGKRYIYKNGVLTELEVANQWSPTILASN